MWKRKKRVDNTWELKIYMKRKRRGTLGKVENHDGLSLPESKREKKTLLLWTKVTIKKSTATSV